MKSHRRPNAFTLVELLVVVAVVSVLAGLGGLSLRFDRDGEAVRDFAAIVKELCFRATDRAGATHREYSLHLLPTGAILCPVDETGIRGCASHRPREYSYTARGRAQLQFARAQEHTHLAAPFRPVGGEGVVLTINEDGVQRVETAAGVPLNTTLYFGVPGKERPRARVEILPSGWGRVINNW